MKKYISIALSLISIGILLYIISNQKQQIKELKTTITTQSQKIQTVDSLTHTIDSLNVELFVEQINTGRYEAVLDRLKTEDTIAAATFEFYLSQTE